MKVPYFIKLVLKEVLRKFSLKMERLSQIEKFLIQIRKIKDENIKYKILLAELKKFPESPALNLALAVNLTSLGDPQKFNQLQKYSDCRNQWLLDTGLDKLDAEFVSPVMYCGSLGNHGPIDTLISANHLNLRNQKKLIAILDKKNGLPLRNESFFEYFKPHINVIDDEDLVIDLKNLSNVLELPLGYCIPLKDSCPSGEVARNIVQTKLMNIKSKPLFNLTDTDRTIGTNILKDMGLPKNAWYVTLHVRGKGYRGENVNNSVDNFRSPDINLYIDAIKYITKLGGWVFRMGDSTMQNIPEIPNCIDYANSNYKSKFMDVFLGATSRFSIVTPSGYMVIARLFDTPLLFSNCTVFEEYYGLQKNDIYLPALLKRNNSNEILNFEKFTSFPIGALINDVHYSSHNLSVIHNTSDELLNATKEMIELTESNNVQINLSEKQTNFKDLAYKNSFLYHKSGLAPNSRISKYFIEKRNNLI